MDHDSELLGLRDAVFDSVFVNEMEGWGVLLNVAELVCDVPGDHVIDTVWDVVLVRDTLRLVDTVLDVVTLVVTVRDGE